MSEIDELIDSIHFFDALEESKKYALESEFLVCYSRGIQRGLSIRDAVVYARSEWDFLG
jgi:hypothetical protein